MALAVLANPKVKPIWINDADPGVAALWTATIREPGRLIEAVRDFNATEDAVQRAKTQLRVPGRLQGIDLAMVALAVRSCAMAGRGAADQHTDKVYVDRWTPGAYIRRIREAHEVLRGRGWGDECTCLDVVEVIRAPGECALFVDPPYPGCAKPVYLFDFSHDDHLRLAKVLHETAQPWILANADHRLPRALYALDTVERVTVDQNSRVTKGAER